jgi:hypothetical protein
MAALGLDIHRACGYRICLHAQKELTADAALANKEKR